MTEIVPTRILAPTRPAREPQGGPVAPRVHVQSVGDIPGLSPRRHGRRGPGEVPAAHVDIIDALDRAVEWPTVAAWLTQKNRATTRRGYLAVAAAFVKWRSRVEPGRGILTDDQDLLTAYREALGSGAATAKGKPAKARTANWHISILSSLFKYAARRGVLSTNAAAFVSRSEVGTVGVTPALTLEEAVTVLRGAEQIAAEHPMDAAAVTLLLLSIRVGELISLTVGRIRRDAGHTVLLFERKGGRNERLPLPARAVTLVTALCAGQPSSAPLLHWPDGRPWNRWKPYTSLRRAARAGGLPKERAYEITPHMSRATAATLLLAANVPKGKVQALLGHASDKTTELYNRGEGELHEHAVHALAKLFANG